MKHADAEPGMGVAYDNGRQREDGEITSVNRMYVFVRFVGDRHSKACSAGDLTPLAIGGQR